MTQRDMAWTKAWRCNSAWLVEAGMWGGKGQVTLGDWGVSGVLRVLGLYLLMFDDLCCEILNLSFALMFPKRSLMIQWCKPQ